MTLHDRLRKNARRIVDAMDAVSRERMLSDEESRVLEHFIEIADGLAPANRRGPYGTTRVLAAMGILRDMTIYRRATGNRNVRPPRPSKTRNRIRGG